MKKGRTEITIEPERPLLIRRCRRFFGARCDRCAERVKMITAAEAAAVACVSLCTITRWVKAGKIPFTETPEELLLICFNSLTKWR